MADIGEEADRLRARCEAAEARAEVAEGRLQAVLDAFPEGVVLLDADGRYVAWNQRYAEIYHRSADLFARGVRLMDVLRVGVARGDYPDAVGQEHAWLQARESQILAGASRYEQRLSDGAHLLVEDRRTAQGETVGLRIDITEMQRQATALSEALEAAEAANAAKSAFLATMSHEIRTPLNGVLGMAQAMAAESLSDSQRERLAVIQGSGEALLAILNDVLDLSKIEAGRLELVPTEFDLSALVHGASSAFAAIAEGKGLAFEVELDAARGRYRGDPVRLRQILHNLISNALKFTDRGEVRVCAERRSDMLEIRVSDTGMGITEANLSRLFQKFVQLDSSATRRVGGSGLGLAICQELAALMHGEITVTSEAGRGSCFTARLPLPRLADEAPQRASGPDLDASRNPATLKVLAAEDNAVNQLVLRTLLAQIGIQPTVVEDGQAAISAWAAEDWDVILMDIQMPVMDGMSAAMAIRRLEQAGDRPRTPIIALTANAMAHQVADYLGAGMDGHVAKPIVAAQLFHELVAAAERRTITELRGELRSAT
jgi:signal transduction histidine kinase/AmiR/NasT family two-component response regulator